MSRHYVDLLQSIFSMTMIPNNVRPKWFILVLVLLTMVTLLILSYNEIRNVLPVRCKKNSLRPLEETVDMEEVQG
jgi:hypothetical protein